MYNVQFTSEEVAKIQSAPLNLICEQLKIRLDQLPPSEDVESDKNDLEYIRDILAFVSAKF